MACIFQTQSTVVYFLVFLFDIICTNQRLGSAFVLSQAL